MDWQYLIIVLHCLRGDTMDMTLKELLDKAIFKDYTILTGHNHLERPVESVSILETPEFEKYIIDRSLVLTTFYPIKNDVEQAKKLLHTLNDHATSGIIVKVNRYIDDVPEELVALAEEMNLPIITLNYDANLSILFNNILSEIQSKDYSNLPFDDSYANILQAVYENPSTKTLMDIVTDMPDLEMLIQNLENKTTHFTSKTVRDYYEQFRHTKNLIKRVEGGMLYYSEDVVYNETAIYRMVFLAKNDRRHIIHNTTEIFKMMIILIYQKKMENSLKFNHFIHNFVSNYASTYNNSELSELSRDYNWNIVFPIGLILFDIRENDKPMIAPSLISYIRTVLVNKFHLNSDEIKYSYMNKQLLFVVNIDETLNIGAVLHKVLDAIHERNPSVDVKIAHSNPIETVHDISKIYSALSEGLQHVNAKSLGINVYSIQHIELLNILKNIDFSQLTQYVDRVLGPLIEYEEEHDVPLINTMHCYFKNRFSAKRTAEELFIHYNSLRYRLGVIEKLGYNFNGESKGFFDLHFALYLRRNFQSEK